MRALSVAGFTVMCVLGIACDDARPPAVPPALQQPVGPAGAFPSNELLAIHRYLESQGKSWHFFYDSVNGKRYQWMIERSVSASGVHYHFNVGREIDESGRIIGGLCPVEDQFFSIRLDPETSEVQEVYGMGG